MNERVQQEIAALAAEMIAESDLDYSTAKRKAARQILGTDRVSFDHLPSNEMIEAAVREYQALYQADTQPARLLALRKLALTVMRQMPGWSLYLVGAVANGTANEHSAISTCSMVALKLRPMKSPTRLVKGWSNESALFLKAKPYTLPAMPRTRRARSALN
jgi:hypothetical protein